MISFSFFGFIFGNLNALAINPFGHIAGYASSVIGALSTFIALTVRAQHQHFLTELQVWLSSHFLYALFQPFFSCLQKNFSKKMNKSSTECIGLISFHFIFISSTALTTVKYLLPIFLPFFSPGKRFFANFTNFLILHGYYSQ